MTQDQMNAEYKRIRREGRIEWDFAPSVEIRLMWIKHDGISSHVCLRLGEVFAITQVKD